VAELESINLLDLTPLRIAHWEKRGDRVVVVRPKSTRTGVNGLIDRLLYALSARRIRLDSIGSFAWLRMDGQHTVAQVADLLREEYGAEVEPAEERLGKLVRAFRREGLISYPGWDDEVINSG
jgi:hypothetical protein